VLDLVTADSITDGIPQWAWEYDGAGRLQLHTLALFAGRPGAGKSTAGRWFAAQWTLGALEGVWRGQPQQVAYIAAEESKKYVVIPGLKAAGADMSHVVLPRVTFDGKEAPLIADHDEQQIIAQLTAAGVRIVIVDPIMATIARKVDIHRSNETRAALEPWVRIAEAIGGIVIGIVHLNKGKNTDVVGAINGSSAFGEVARCVFGFVKDDESDDGERIMSQIKNSCGREDLSLTYKITGQVVTTADGDGPMPRFELGGHSERSVEDVMSSTAAGAGRTSSPEVQRVVDFVNSRDSTGPGDLVDAGLATTPAVASNKLRRAVKQGFIDNPLYGHYTRNAPPVPSLRPTARVDARPDDLRANFITHTLMK
jgi:AAA domain